MDMPGENVGNANANEKQVKPINPKLPVMGIRYEHPYGARKHHWKLSAMEESVGVGAHFEATQSGAIKVRGLSKGSPADLSGLFSIGDELVEVDGVKAFGRPLSELGQYVLGAPFHPATVFSLPPPETRPIPRAPCPSCQQPTSTSHIPPSPPAQPAQPRLRIQHPHSDSWPHGRVPAAAAAAAGKPGSQVRMVLCSRRGETYEACIARGKGADAAPRPCMEPTVGEFHDTLRL